MVCVCVGTFTMYSSSRFCALCYSDFEGYQPSSYSTFFPFINLLYTILYYITLEMYKLSNKYYNHEL